MSVVIHSNQSNGQRRVVQQVVAERNKRVDIEGSLDQGTLDFLKKVFDYAVMRCGEDRVKLMLGNPTFDSVDCALQKVEPSWNATKRLVAWTLLFASMFAWIRPGYLTMTSGNCLFTLVKAAMMDPKMAEKEVTLFVKALPMEWAKDLDCICVDNVNGMYFNKLCQTETWLQDHVMHYVDSFLSNHDVYRIATDDIVWDAVKTATVADGHALCPGKPDLCTKTALCHTSVSHAILGQSLDQMAYTMDGEFLYRLPTCFPPFFEALMKLGLKYGFLHNDLHLGNVFYDRRSNSLRLIDYGRSYVHAMKQDAEVLRFLHKDLKKNALADVADYDAFIRTYGGEYMRYTSSVPLQSVLNIVSLCANTALLWKGYKQASRRPGADVFDGLCRFLIPMHSKTRKGVAIQVPSTSVGILSAYDAWMSQTALRLAPQERALCTCLAEGLLYFALFVRHMVPGQYMPIPIGKLPHMYVFFQWTGSQEDLSRCVDGVYEQMMEYMNNHPHSYVRKTQLVQKLTGQSGGNEPVFYAPTTLAIPNTSPMNLDQDPYAHKYTEEAYGNILQQTVENLERKRDIRDVIRTKQNASVNANAHVRGIEPLREVRVTAGGKKSKDTKIETKGGKK